MTDFFENLLSNGELQEEIAELQGKLDAYQMSENEANEIIAELKAENEQLKEENFNFEEVVKLCKCELYEQILQQIKAIVCSNCEIIDPQGRKDILKLISKAEEE